MLQGKTLLYPHGKCVSPPWRDFAAVTDYVPTRGLDVPPKSKPLSVLAAIPAFNEGPTIGSVVLRAKQYAQEVVVIDDGSKDDTAEIAALAGAHVIQHARNLGKGTAIRTAWLFARERHPEALVLLDGDHQHDPKDIPRVVEPILAGTAPASSGGLLPWSLRSVLFSSSAYPAPCCSCLRRLLGYSCSKSTMPRAPSPSAMRSSSCSSGLLGSSQSSSGLLSTR